MIRLIQIVPVDGCRLFGKIVKKEIEISRKNRGAFYRSGAKEKNRAKWAHERYNGWINIQRADGEVVTVEIRSRSQAGDEWQLLQASECLHAENPSHTGESADGYEGKGRPKCPKNKRTYISSGGDTPKLVEDHSGSKRSVGEKAADERERDGDSNLHLSFADRFSSATREARWL